MAKFHRAHRETVAREHPPCSACKAMMQIIASEGASLQRQKLSVGKLMRPRKQAVRRPAKQSRPSISSACGRRGEHITEHITTRLGSRSACR
eukprot:6203589-Pleurochrysis_carterae.AAC.4